MTEDTNNTTNLTRDQAIEFIMDHYGEAVKRIIYSYVKSHHTTDDLFQEVLILIYRKWEKYDGRSQLITWVIRIAINRCKDYLRSPLHRIKLVKDHWLDQKDYQDAEVTVIQQEQWDEIAEAILNLPIKNREVMILMFQHNMSLKEIAEVTGAPVSTIKTRMQRAKSLLKKHVSEEEWTLE
ncbi:sigma-70 family RNA polymerase sigma factor [Virgibacillus salinus]|uniref:RNA polymerase sigma-70 factor, ECF subfamily n=1 Tax=Virgibacillus salinus TaxID=553311 RepID=A0A1H1F320_9BACI|nr:sigma-70 family RNA polymerase sigma factor [Virgibacillus salinus]SDQ95301.1 RNA polymerase sigma-70 factor, ECF subfamily [Virgibacillus salinus]